MAKLDLWSCDNCGKEFRSSEGNRVTLVVENSATATFSSAVDLCCSCLTSMLHDMATQVSPAMKAEIMSRYTQRKGV